MSIDASSASVCVHSTHTRPWEESESFHDTLYQWMNRAPWLAISCAAHLIIFLIVQAIPWALFEREDMVVIICTIADVPDPLPDPPPLEPVLPIDPEQVDQIPQIQDVPVDVISDAPSDFPDLEPDGDADSLVDSPFQEMGTLGVLGLGGGPGSKYGGRFGRRGSGVGGRGTAPALEAGLQWLAEHQDEDGRWDCDGFMRHDPLDDLCTGPGSGLHDIGVTGLALLAFLGDGSTTRTGPYKKTVRRGLRWLLSQQDPDTGLIGDPVGKAFLYDHAIATLAICEAYYFDDSPTLEGTAQAAINYITRARNPYGAWRYEVPPIGDNDTSVTGWMVFCLASAQEAGLKTDPDALAASLNWFDEVTDLANGRVGYREPGSASSRIDGVNNQWPTDSGEALTAVGLLCRFFLGQYPDETSAMTKHADLMLKTLPIWDPEGLGCDMYYWYYGTYAMYQMGGRHWKAWNKAMKTAVLGSQRTDGAHAGSWDPAGPWGMKGGRVYSTAMMALSLEVYFRYGRIIGTR